MEKWLKIDFKFLGKLMVVILLKTVMDPAYEYHPDRDNVTPYPTS